MVWNYLFGSVLLTINFNAADSSGAFFCEDLLSNSFFNQCGMTTSPLGIWSSSGTFFLQVTPPFQSRTRNKRNLRKLLSFLVCFCRTLGSFCCIGDSTPAVVNFGRDWFGWKLNEKSRLAAKGQSSTNAVLLCFQCRKMANDTTYFTLISSSAQFCGVSFDLFN